MPLKNLGHYIFKRVCKDQQLLRKTQPMNTYRLYCTNIGEFVIELQADSIEQAEELVNADVNKHKIIKDENINWTVNSVIKVGDVE